MRILQICSGRAINGAMVYVDLLTRQLVAMGHEVAVLCAPRSWLWDRLDGVPIERIGSRMNRNWKELRRVDGIVRQRRIDVLQTHLSRAHIFGLLLRYLSRVPVVATAHSWQFQPHWYWNDFVIANSEATRRFQMTWNRVPGHRIRTVHCFPDVRRFAEHRLGRREMRQLLRLVDGQPVLAIIGEVAPRKGHLHLFRALPEIAASHPDVRLLVVGRTDRQTRWHGRLVSFLEKRGLKDRVAWLGVRDDIPDLLGAVDVCVVPSVDEALGLVAIEAQAAGVPVVASSAGGLPEIIQHEVNGLLVPVGGGRAIAAAVLRLLADPSLRWRLSECGRQSALTNFDSAILSGRVADILEEVAGGGARRRSAA